MGYGGRERSRVHSNPGASRSGGGRFLQVLWAGGGWCAASAESGGRLRKRLSPGPWSCHCSLFSSTLLPAKASFLLSALQALSSALPASLREEREVGLGEVERLIPGEEAGGERRGCQSGCDTSTPPQAPPWPSRVWTQGPGHIRTPAPWPFTPSLDSAAPLRMNEGLSWPLPDHPLGRTEHPSWNPGRGPPGPQRIQKAQTSK